MLRVVFSVLLLQGLFSLGVSSQVSQEQKHSEVSVENLDLIAQSINKRLSFMKDVAAYKWENGLVIEDKSRELIVLKASQESAFQNELDSLTTRKFFELQIALAKKIQQYWFNEWKNNEVKPSDFLDLQKVVRPELIRLGDEIIQNIRIAGLEKNSRHKLFYKKEVFIKRITTEGLSKEDKEDLFELVVMIKLNTG